MEYFNLLKNIFKKTLRFCLLSTFLVTTVVPPSDVQSDAVDSPCGWKGCGRCRWCRWGVRHLNMATTRPPCVVLAHGNVSTAPWSRLPVRKPARGVNISKYYVVHEIQWTRFWRRAALRRQRTACYRFRLCQSEIIAVFVFILNKSQMSWPLQMQIVQKFNIMSMEHCRLRITVFVYSNCRCRHLAA